MSLDVEFVEADATTWRGSADRLLCVGASHAWGGTAEWLLANPGHPRATELRDWLDGREREYVSGYRGTLGMAYTVLAR